MPRLPDLDTLGARPVPVSRTGIVRNQTAGVVGDAISGIGEQLGRAGQQQMEKQDRLAYASAKAMVANEDIKARTALANDPDFTTAEKRYLDHMTEVKTNAAKLLGSGFDRKAFEIDSSSDILRGSVQVAAMAHGKQVDQGRADLSSTIDGLSKSAADAPDDASRQNIFLTVNDLVSGAKENGYISAEEAGSMARGFVANDAGNRIERALADDKVDAASRILEDAKDALPTSRYTDYHKMIMGKMQARETYDDTSVIMGGGWNDKTGSPVNYADPLRGRGQGVTDAYGASRPGGATHNGVDFAAAKGTPIHAIGAGKVVKADHDERSGNFVIIDHGDGTTSSYSHLESASPLKAGDVVSPDTILGAVGSTGHSTGPHLHLVVKENGATVDPTKVIGRAQQEPKRHDLDALLARADALAADQGWSFERRERAKDEIRRRVSLDEGLKARQENEADRQAQEAVLAKGDAFTDVSQIPRSIWDQMSVGARDRYTDQAKANRKQETAKPNGDVATKLELLRILRPDDFLKVNVGEYAHLMTPAEVQGLRKDQAELIANPPGSKVDLRGKVSATIGTYDDPDMWSSDKEDAARQRVRVQRIMEEDLRALTGGKRDPTEAELYQAFNSATGVALTFNKTFLGMETGGKREVRRYDIKASDIPDNIATRIRAALKSKTGKDPTDDQVAQEYQIGKGRFW